MRVLIEKLKNNEQYTDTEQAICQYILKHADDISKLRIGDLSKETATSNSAVIRLCRKLGTSGYRDFKIELVKELEKIRQERNTIDVDFPFTKRESSQDIIHQIAVLSQETIQTCYEAISAVKLQQAAQIIFKAENIYIYALGDTQISSLSFMNRLIKLKKRTFLCNQYGETPAILNMMNKKDVFLLISYSGRVQLDQKSMQRIKKSGCKTILISSNEYANYFDLTILIPKKEDYDHKIATYYSQIAITYIFHCLYAILYSLNQ